MMEIFSVTILDLRSAEADWKVGALWACRRLAD